jgi:hypothetical protein
MDLFRLRSASPRPRSAKGKALVLRQLELEAVLLCGGDVELLALFRREFERVGDEVDLFRRWLLVAAELIDIGRRAAGLGSKLGLRHARLGERDAHRGKPLWEARFCG